jgi:hypothetical protein
LAEADPGRKVPGKQIHEVKGGYQLGECQISHIVAFDPKKGDIGLKNA